MRNAPLSRWSKKPARCSLELQCSFNADWEANELDRL
jgi:hypothetical protein